jgi:CRP-like cAMP-binding protein
MDRAEHTTPSASKKALALPSPIYDEPRSPPAELLQRESAGTQLHDPGAVLQAEGFASARLRLLVSGWAARTRALPDGRRQIVRLLVPGDLLGFDPSVEGAHSCSTVALTSVRTADLGPTAQALDPENPENAALRTAITWAARHEQEGLLSQIVRLGRLSAYERTAHLLLELYERLGWAGLSDERTMLMPLTQEMLADTLGLSMVHINRTLQALRRRRLVVSGRGRITLPDPKGLADVCGYVFTAPIPTGRSHNRAPSRPREPPGETAEAPTRSRGYRGHPGTSP